MSTDHEAWMRLAVETAERARGKTGDNPWVGCVIVDRGGALLGTGHTQGPGEDHAEIAAARAAQAGGHSVLGATLYSTLEPCSMCVGALLESNVETLVYAVPNAVDGAAGSVVQLAQHEGLPRRMKVISGIRRDEAEELLGATNGATPVAARPRASARR